MMVNSSSPTGATGPTGNADLQTSTTPGRDTTERTTIRRGVDLTSVDAMDQVPRRASSRTALWSERDDGITKKGELLDLGAGRQQLDRPCGDLDGDTVVLDIRRTGLRGDAGIAEVA